MSDPIQINADHAPLLILKPRTDLRPEELARLRDDIRNSLTNPDSIMVAPANMEIWKRVGDEWVRMGDEDWPK